jgi:sphinganine-1-phosphate aldolase
VEGVIQKELDKVTADMEEKLVLRPPNLPAIVSLPENGLDPKDIEELLVEYEEMDDADVANGRVSGTVYSMDSRLRQVILTAYSRFLYSNPLHPDVFKSVRKMEAEVVAMTISMFGGDESCVGVMTSGGTESILLACKAYRDKARLERGILFPEIIAPSTVHAAFEKAAHYFGIRLVEVGVDLETGRADISEIRKLVTPNTIALVGSAPCFSLGVIDDIETIAAIALDHEIGCHVDCCLGSFLLPHLSGLNRASITPFDFRVPGVTSISCDPHKYGFAPKGSSVVMYSSNALRQYQYFVSTEWSGGIYATPTIMGSRPGGLVAATWAAMMAMGQDGYRQAAAQIVLVVDRICDGIRHIEDLFVFGQPASSVVAFGSRVLNIYAINDAMSRRGWHLNALQNPAAVHIACTMLTSELTVEEFLHDLTESVSEVRAQPLLTLGTGTAAIYGTSTALPDKSIIADVAKAYVDILYKL